MSHHSTGALIVSSTKTHAIEVATQNYTETTMCWDGMLLHSLKSLTRQAFDHPQPNCREGLLTCLLHLSLWVKNIMVPSGSQMLTQNLNTLRGLNISDPHHLAAIFHLRGLLNTSILPTPQKILNFRGTFQPTPISRNFGGLLKHFHFSYHPQQYSISRGLPAIVSIINLSSFLCVASGENLLWGPSICGPWPRNSNPVTVELGNTFHHSSTLPLISMDF